MALAKESVAATLPGIVISDLALKVSRSGSAALRVSQVRSAVGVVVVEAGNPVGLVAEVVG